MGVTLEPHVVRGRDVCLLSCHWLGAAGKTQPGPESRAGPRRPPGLSESTVFLGGSADGTPHAGLPGPGLNALFFSCFSCALFFASLLHPASFPYMSGRYWLGSLRGVAMGAAWGRGWQLADLALGDLPGQTVTGDHGRSVPGRRQYLSDCQLGSGLARAGHANFKPPKRTQ